MQSYSPPKARAGNSIMRSIAYEQIPRHLSSWAAKERLQRTVSRRATSGQEQGQLPQAHTPIGPALSISKCISTWKDPRGRVSSPFTWSKELAIQIMNIECLLLMYLDIQDITSRMPVLPKPRNLLASAFWAFSGGEDILLEQWEVTHWTEPDQKPSTAPIEANIQLLSTFN